MENKDKCIILKRKEYDDLVEKANSVKPDKIEVVLYNNGSFYGSVQNTIDLSMNIRCQIKRLAKLLREDLENKIEDITVLAYKNVASKSYRQRRKFLKKYE